MSIQTVLKKIKEDIPHGFQTRIAVKAGVSKSHVNSVLAGKIRTSKLTKLLIEEYAAHKRKESELIKKFEAVN
nr:hypothetical protein [Bacteroidota bacterium]